MEQPNPQNPYAPPTHEESEALGAAAPIPPAVWKVALRWSAICVVSAVPSFFWGCTLHNQVQHILAMLAGIAVFVVAYTCAELSKWYRKLATLPGVKLTLLVGYATRIVVSLIFPLGATVDVFTGMISVSLVSGPGAEPVGQLEEASFLTVFLTTLVQGVLLNAVLFTYMAVIHGMQRLFVVASRQLGQSD